MAYSTSSDVTELLPEITLEVDYIFQNASLGRSLVDYFDVSGEAGIIVEVPRFTEVAADIAPGESAEGSSHTMNIAMGTGTLARRAVTVGLSYLAARTPYDLAQRIGNAIGMAQVKAIDASIFGVVTGTTNWTTGTGATNAVLNLANVQAGILLLKENEVDDPISGVLHPKQWNSIVKAFSPVTTATDSTAIAIGNMVSDQMLANYKGNFYGVNWFENSRIGSGTVTATTQVYNGLLFDKRGIGYGYAGLKGFQVEPRPSEAQDVLVLNWADTSFVSYDSGVCKLYSKNG